MNKKQIIEKKVSEYQSLYNEILEDIKYLKEVNKNLPKIEKRMVKMAAYYDKSWLAHSEEVLSDKEAYARHKKEVKMGTYSILSQDTIWNTMQDERDEIVKILKYISKGLD